MDLIYMNQSKEDIGVLKDYTLDMAFGTDENNFECEVSASNNVCEAGFYLYMEGTEYGGIIDSINVDTEDESVTYKGRTWHGILDSKVLEPDSGADYLVVSGEANTVLSTLITRMGLGAMFTVSSEDSGVNISSYKMNRYISGFAGILKMLKANGAKLNVIFKNGFVELSAEPFVDYSKDEQFDTDQISFTIQKNYKPVNHVICLGQGELKDRRVIHLYADGVGNISGKQTFTGVDEVTEIFEYPNAESDEELIEGGVEIIKASWASDTIEFDFETDDESFDINDVIGAVEFTTGTEVKAHITKKIIKIKDYTTAISYSCESGVGTVASSGYPSSGSGGSSGGSVDAYTKAETDALLEGKSDASHNHDSVYANATHNHDDRYYTESEVDTLLSKKQATISGGASTIVSNNLTKNRALVSDGSGKVVVSAVTSTELGYLDGVTSAIQTQINAINSKFDYIEPSSSGVSLTSYNSSSKYYTCPNDGYVRVNSWGSYGATIYTVKGFNVACNAGQQTAVFFKKGARIYVAYDSTTSLQIHFFACATI